MLLVAPPALSEATVQSEVWGFADRQAMARQLSRLYRAVAESRDVVFLDAASLVSGDPADGVHLSASSHRLLAEAVAPVVRQLLG